MTTLLGHVRHGDGAHNVLVLHDWFCDHTSWDAVLPYLDTSRFTYVFADLRGYGASRHLAGEHSLEEAATDALAVADHLGWKGFSVVGHSMSGLVAQRLAQLAPDRIDRLIAVTPVSPGGMGLDPATVAASQALALGDDDVRLSGVRRMWGDRLSETWLRFKLRRWRETADPAAAAAYVPLWGCTPLPPADTLSTPVLVIAAEQDAPPFRRAHLEASMRPRWPGATVVSLDASGHYPMQELPPLFAATIERFLGGRGEESRAAGLTETQR